MFNKKENALIQMSDGTQAQLGEPTIYLSSFIKMLDAGCFVLNNFQFNSKNFVPEGHLHAGIISSLASV